MSESCYECFGRGYVITCIDDMCHGGEECIHGDGEEPCRACDGEGYIDGPEDDFGDDEIAAPPRPVDLQTGPQKSPRGDHHE